MRASVSKSGKPCAKFTARSGPFSSRLRRVISRITDSVKLSALSDWLRLVRSVPRICALQMKVGAGTGVTAHRALKAALPPTANGACPPGLGEELEHVGAAKEADHLAGADHRHAANPLADEQPGSLVDPRLLGDLDHPLAHDVARDLPVLGEDVGLRNDP